MPETTWDQLEKAFRLNKFNTFLIARVSLNLVIHGGIADTAKLGEGTFGDADLD